MNIFTKIYNEVINDKIGTVKTYPCISRQVNGDYSVQHLFIESGYLSKYVEILKHDDSNITIKRIARIK